MRYILPLIMTVMLATPAFGDSLCNVTGPHNCTEQINDKLASLTRATAAHVSQTQDHHPFKTQNDYILAASANAAKQIQCFQGTMFAMGSH